MVTEYWLNTHGELQLSEAAQNGINIFAKCRLHKSVSHEKKEKTGMKVRLSQTNVDAYNSLYVLVTEKNKKCVLGVVNRPPKQNKENDVENYNEIKLS